MTVYVMLPRTPVQQGTTSAVWVVGVAIILLIMVDDAPSHILVVVYLNTISTHWAHCLPCIHVGFSA